MGTANELGQGVAALKERNLLGLAATEGKERTAGKTESCRHSD